MFTFLRSSRAVASFYILSSAALFMGCPEPEVTNHACLAPTAAALMGTPLRGISYSFDSYYPISTSRADGRVALHTTHTDAGSEGRYAARVWSGGTWQTWDLAGTTYAGGFGSYANFRTVHSGGTIHAVANMLIDTVAVTAVFSENATHDGFAEPQTVVNLSRFILHDTGSLDTYSYAAAIGTGQIGTSVSNSGLVIIEKNDSGVWNASLARPMGTALTTTLRPQAVGYHTDGTPWILYKEDTGSGTRSVLKITRRVGAGWLAGVVIDADADSTDGERVDVHTIETPGMETAVFFWGRYAAGGARVRMVHYDLNTMTAGPIRLSPVTGTSACGNCHTGAVAYESDGIHGVWSGRDSSLNTMRVGTVEEEAFLAAATFVPDYAVQGTTTVYYNSCDNGFATFWGRPARDASAPLDFYVVPLPARDPDAMPGV